MDPNSVNSFLADHSIMLAALVPLAAALVGVLIGACMVRKATLKGMSLADKRDVRKREETRKLALQSFYKALLVETKTLWDMYEEAIGSKVESLRQVEPAAWYHPITHEQFVVYRANSALIGSISDDRLRSLVVKTYGEMQNLTELYRMNNDLLAQWQHWDRMDKEGQDAVPRARAQGAYAVLVEFANVLRKAHYTVRANVSDLIESLERNIQIPKKNGLSKRP